MASSEHPVWRGHSKEAKRRQPCGPRITRNCAVMGSLLLPCAPTWLFLVAGWCLMGATPRGQPWTLALMLPHGRDGLSARRLAVWWTFHEPSLGRHVLHELMRNAVLNLTLIIPANTYKRRSYYERYSRSMLRGRRQRTRARSGGPRDHPHRLWDHRANRSGLAGFACQPHDQYVRGGAQQPDDTPARAADGTEGQCLLERPRLFGVSTHPRVCVLPFRCPTPWPAATLTYPMPTKGHKGSYKKWKSVTPAMAAGLTDHVWTMDELLSFRVPPKSLWL